MRRPSTASSALVLGLAAASSARAADFAQPGPYAFTESQPPTGLLPGVSDISVITPNQAGQYPLVIATHGWSAGRVNQVGWAKHMASYGYVVIVPGRPNPIAPDQAVWSANIRTLATNAVNASLFPQLAAKIDATKIVYEGFSAGGLASTLAAKDKAPNLLVLLDPVDNQQNLGATAIRSVCSPVLNFFTQPSACNNQMGWSTFASNGTGPLVRVGIKASTHCDGEDEARALCGTFCGGAAKTTNRDTIRKYMVAYLEGKLRGSTEAAALFTASALGQRGAREHERGRSPGLRRDAPAARRRRRAERRRRDVAERRRGDAAGRRRGGRFERRCGGDAERGRGHRRLRHRGGRLRVQHHEGVVVLAARADGRPRPVPAPPQALLSATRRLARRG